MQSVTSLQRNRECGHLVIANIKVSKTLGNRQMFTLYVTSRTVHVMGLLPDILNNGSRMRREYRERFPCHRIQRKLLVSDPDMHHGTCVTHVPRCMSGLLTHGGGENISGIPEACATRTFTYLARVLWQDDFTGSWLERTGCLRRRHLILFVRVIYFSTVTKLFGVNQSNCW